MGLNPAGSATESLLDDTSTATSAAVSTTSEAVDRTASAASEIRREKSLTDNFCAVREDAEGLATGAKAEQLGEDAARMQKRELAIDADFMVVVIKFILCLLRTVWYCCSLSAVLFCSKEAHRHRPKSQRKIQGGGLNF